TCAFRSRDLDTLREARSARRRVRRRHGGGEQDGVVSVPDERARHLAVVTSAHFGESVGFRAGHPKSHRRTRRYVCDGAFAVAVAAGPADDGDDQDDTLRHGGPPRSGVRLYSAARASAAEGHSRPQDSNPRPALSRAPPVRHLARHERSNGTAMRRGIPGPAKNRSATGMLTAKAGSVPDSTD